MNGVVSALADLEDGDDVRMIEGGERSGFVAESSEAVVVSLKCGRQELDRDRAPQLLVEGAVDDAHPAFADAVADTIPRRDQLTGRACIVSGHDRLSIVSLPFFIVLASGISASGGPASLDPACPERIRVPTSFTSQRDATRHRLQGSHHVSRVRDQRVSSPQKHIGAMMASRGKVLLSRPMRPEPSSPDTVPPTQRDEDVERIARYAFDLGNGGWQTRLLGIFGRGAPAEQEAPAIRKHPTLTILRAPFRSAPDRDAFAFAEQTPAAPIQGDPVRDRKELCVARKRRLVPHDVQEREAVVTGAVGHVESIEPTRRWARAAEHRDGTGSSPMAPDRRCKTGPTTGRSS